VAKSIKTLEDGCRNAGHDVRVIAPEFDGADVSPHVLRVPAIQHFNGSDFCVRLPVPNVIRDFMDDFQPDIIHSHHPFLLGDAALREAWKMRIPIVFTHHTLYERYTHYVPLDSAALKRVAIQMATEYCNLCDLVIAPSESIAKLLHDREVSVPIKVTPTGIDTEAFSKGNGWRCRKKLGIPAACSVIGHVGRLAKEKNLHYLAEAVAACLEDEPKAVFLLVGDGDSHEEMLEVLLEKVEPSRIYHPGKMTGSDLIDAYAAIDVFAFTSQTETQGMVLAEAMAVGKPVVALDGPGVREIVRDNVNGVMLDSHAEAGAFSEALLRLLRDPDLLRDLAGHARESAKEYDVHCCVQAMIDNYEELVARNHQGKPEDLTQWDRVLSGIEIEWELFAAKVSAAAAALIETPATEATLD
jgi:1,2-diacylglycerol 3-alpha-glucosyltransferase